MKVTIEIPDDVIARLAAALGPYLQQIKPEEKTEQSTEWIDEKTTRLILGGGAKPIARKTLMKYRNERKIEYRAKDRKSYLYNRNSIIKFIESK